MRSYRFVAEVAFNHRVGGATKELVLMSGFSKNEIYLSNMLFSSVWSFNVNSGVKTLPRYFTLCTILIDFPAISVASCLHFFELQINALVFR